MNQSDQQASPTLYVFSGKEIIELPYDKEVHYPDGVDTFTPSVAMLSVSCDNCGGIVVLIDEDVEQTETHERQMGNENYYEATCFGVCESCGWNLEVYADFSEYAYTWVFFNRVEYECKMVDLAGFENALRTFEEISRRARANSLSQSDDDL